MSKAQTLPTWQKKLDNLRRLAYSTYFGTKNRLELVTTLEDILKESELQLSTQKAEMVKKIEGMKKNPKYLVSEADAVSGYNEALSDLLDTLNEGTAK